MFDTVRWYTANLVEKIRKFLKPETEWQCYFCHKIFYSEHPHVNAYSDGAAIYQCEECRIRLDLELTPTDNPKLDSEG